MESYEEIVMQAVSQLMVKAMSEQRISDEKVSVSTDELVEISQKVMAARWIQHLCWRKNRAAARKQS